MSESIYQPYTYLIGWSSHNRYYYGVRYAKDCNPNDLWVSYFTSSKYVKDFVELYGDPDVIQIRKTFCTVDGARFWEHKVLKRLKVVNNPIFLNESDGLSISLEASRQKKSHRTRQKMSLYHTGRKRSKEMCESISKSKKGVPLSEQGRNSRKIAMNVPSVKERLSEIGKTKTGNLNNFYGKNHTEKTKKTISEKKAGSVPPNRKSVIVDGIEYESIESAHISTGISKYLIRKTLK